MCLPAIRHHTSLDKAGRLLARNDARISAQRAADDCTFCDIPEAIANTRIVSERLEFTLDNLGYEFPHYPDARGRNDGQLSGQARGRGRAQTLRVTGEAAFADEGASSR